MKITATGASQRAAWYDRNPLSLSGFDFETLAVAPHGVTSRWLYTVPTGRKALITSAIIAAVRTTAATTAGRVRPRIYAATPSVQSLLWFWFNNNVGDADKELTTSTTTALLAGHQVTGDTQDGSTGGTMDYVVAITGTEFDA